MFDPLPTFIRCGYAPLAALLDIAFAFSLAMVPSLSLEYSFTICVIASLAIWKTLHGSPLGPSAIIATN
jgi:hypothetical protein